MSEKIDVKAAIREEYKRCAQSPQYFIRKYCHIQHPIRGRILFDLYDYQEKAITDFEDNQFNVVLKGRQIGISTAVACYALWLMLFYKDKNILVIATKQDTAKNLITKVRYAFENLPIWLKVECTEKNKLSMRFRNGSQIKASTAAGDSGRSEALSLLILDEAAFIKNAEEIWTAALPTLSTGGKGVLISTPNGVGNFFHKTWANAITHQSDTELSDGRDALFNPIKLDWKVVPGRTQEWRDSMTRHMGEREARQEYDAEFIGSGNTVVDAELIEHYATLTTQPAYKRGLDGNIWVWESPNPSKAYVIVADVARGDGLDKSAFHVLDVESCRQVAEYKGKVNTNDFADMLVAIGTEYMDALLVVENANHGWAVLQRIIDRGYRNLFYMTEDLRVVDDTKPQSNKLYAKEKKSVAGFTTSSRTRPLIISKLTTYMLDHAVQIMSMRTIEELRVFIWDNGKAQAMEGYNDDLVMSLSIGLWVRDTALQLHAQGIQLSKLALDKFHRTGGEPIYTPLRQTEDPYRIPGVMPGQFEDIRWLLG